MLSSDQKPLEILNDLNVINNKRIESYHYVDREIDVPVLNALFERLIGTSLECKKELRGEIYKLGGMPSEIFLWEKDLRKRLRSLVSLSRSDHKAILDSFVQEEDAVISCYESALSDTDENITTQHYRLFNKHCQLIRSDQEKIKNLLDVFNKYS